MSGEEARVNVYCRFRPINKLERETWEKNRLGILLKLEELQNLEPQFHKRKNKKFLDPRNWKRLAEDTRKLKKQIPNMTKENVLRFKRLTNSIDVSDWDEESRFFRENMGVQLFPDLNQIQTADNFGKRRAFTFDNILMMDSTQTDVFQTLGVPMIHDALAGMNVTLCAYGQTGTGKTFTTIGPEPILRASFDELGLVPLSFAYLFDLAAEDEDIVNLILEIEIVEIYRGKVRDLLQPKDPKTKKPKNITLQEVPDLIKDPEKRRAIPKEEMNKTKKRRRRNRKKNVAKEKDANVPKKIKLTGTFKAPAMSVHDIQVLLSRASKHRTRAQTGMNKSSSRSHLILRAKIVQHKSDAKITHSWLTFCDLAGSEKVRKTNVKGKQLKEAQDINQQLTNLRDVVDCIVKKKKFIPYKDAMLTRVLRYSLVGNVKTHILICCSPHAWNQSETFSALSFGSRCKLIKNKVVVNEVVTKDALLERVLLLEKENAELKEQIANNKMKEFIRFLEKDAEEKTTAWNFERQTYESEISRLQTLNEELEGHIEELEQNTNLVADNEKIKEELLILNDHIYEDPDAAEILRNILLEFDIEMPPPRRYYSNYESYNFDESVEASSYVEPISINDSFKRVDTFTKNYFNSQKLSPIILDENEKNLSYQDIVNSQTQYLQHLARDISKSPKTPKSPWKKESFSISRSEHTAPRKSSQIVKKIGSPSAGNVDFNIIVTSDYSSEESTAAAGKRFYTPPRKKSMHRRQNTLIDPVLDLADKITSENINELRTYLRSILMKGQTQFTFNSFIQNLTSWQVSDIAAFWVIVSPQNDPEVRIDNIMTFLTRLEHYLDKDLTAKSLQNKLGTFADEFKQVLATIPSIHFADIDVDGDDKISLEQLSAHLDGTQQLVVEKLFEALDSRHNGFVSKMEFDILKNNLKKDFSSVELTQSEAQMRHNFSQLFHTYVPDVNEIFKNPLYVSSGKKLTSFGAIHILSLLRNPDDDDEMIDDFGSSYLIGLKQQQLEHLMSDMPQQIWNHLVDTPVE